MDFDAGHKISSGVGAKPNSAFGLELGIHSVEDLLRHYPYKYVDRSRFYYLHELTRRHAFYR